MTSLQSINHHHHHHHHHHHRRRRRRRRIFRNLPTLPDDAFSTPQVKTVEFRTIRNITYAVGKAWLKRETNREIKHGTERERERREIRYLQRMRVE